MRGGSSYFDASSCVSHFETHVTYTKKLVVLSEVIAPPVHSKWLDGCRLNLVLRTYTKFCRVNLISVRIDPLQCLLYMKLISDFTYMTLVQIPYCTFHFKQLSIRNRYFITKFSSMITPKSHVLMCQSIIEWYWTVGRFLWHSVWMLCYLLSHKWAFL
jgi:hypothetical protein